MTTSATMITDVVNPSGDRLTIYLVDFHRFTQAEVNTHRSHSRSSASSRAVPVEKMLERALKSPAWPVVWASEKPGMQGGNELTGQDLEDAQGLMRKVADYTTQQIHQYLLDHPDKSTRLHKSLLNRMMEWFQYQTIIFGATDDGWANLFAQRASKFSPNAQPELRLAADMMLEQYEASTPTPIDYSYWVTPLIQPDESLDLDTRRKVSTARCARTSYFNHLNVRDIDDDLRLFEETLMAPKPRHAAPSEFVCRPLRPGETQLGNFRGYRQFRHIIEGIVEEQ